MLNRKGFDLWAGGYDKSVSLSDESDTYPFAGYKVILNEIYNRVLSSPGKRVLDIGFGTGTLTSKLYEQGCCIFGQDFSHKDDRSGSKEDAGGQTVSGRFFLWVGKGTETAFV